MRCLGKLTSVAGRPLMPVLEHRPARSTFFCARGKVLRSRGELAARGSHMPRNERQYFSPGGRATQRSVVTGAQRCECEEERRTVVGGNQSTVSIGSQDSVAAPTLEACRVSSESVQSIRQRPLMARPSVCHPQMPSFICQNSETPAAFAQAVGVSGILSATDRDEPLNRRSTVRSRRSPPCGDGCGQCRLLRDNLHRWWYREPASRPEWFRCSRPCTCSERDAVVPVR